ncbi:MAG: glycosyltransferase family 39 protein [Helicobacteraceae bacterium]|jgi:hypothetical protein|nr:glycosyltransferase family 39 protein [Helicobacteraceae bacterium]
MGYREKVVLFFYTIFNVIANQFINFYSDETYYWLWSKNLGLSYFDNPPKVAYMIKLTTLFSDEPMFVRLSAALMVSGTAYVLYLLAKKIFDEKSAIYTFYIFLSSILILAASTLITPDIPLMFFWALTLYSAYIYLEEDNKKYALITGLSAGALLLSKYTGILPIFTILVYILLYKRAVFKDIYFYGALVLAVIVFSPVLYWNYLHDFISFTFQLQHGVEIEEKVFKVKEFFSFIGLQFALFHPFYLLPLFYFIIRDKARFERKKVYLLLPFLFVFFFFSYNAAFKEANAQWAAGAYLSASVLLGYYLAKYDYKKFLIAGVSFSAFLLIILKTPIGDYIPPIERLHLRLGHIDKFKDEIEAMHLDLGIYDYLLIDDYHGSEVPYYFRRDHDILVLNNARFSQFNIWRHDDQGIAMASPLRSIPKLGRCLYIGKNKSHADEIGKLFGNQQQLAYESKRVGLWDLQYYFVEYEN